MFFLSRISPTEFSPYGVGRDCKGSSQEVQTRSMDRKVEKLKRVLGGSGPGARLIGEKSRLPSDGVMLTVGLVTSASSKHCVHI